MNSEDITAVSAELNKINERNEELEKERRVIKPKLTEKDNKINNLEDKIKMARAAISNEEMNEMINTNIEKIIEEREKRRSRAHIPI